MLQYWFQKVLNKICWGNLGLFIVAVRGYNYLMGEKSHKKLYEVSWDGRITMYPNFIETKEKGRLRLILKRLTHFRKGH